MRAAPDGMRPPDLRDTAWEAAIASGAMQHLDSATVYRLASVYVQQKTGVNTTWPRIVDSFMRPEAFQPSMKHEMLEFLRLSFTELASEEEHLRGVYREALDGLGGDCG